MALTRDEVKTRKAKVILRAQRNLQEKLARIDWDEEVLYPTIEALKAGHAVPQLNLPAGAEFTVKVINADPLPASSAKSE